MAQVHAGDMAGALHQTDQGPEDHLQSASTWVVVVTWRVVMGVLVLGVLVVTWVLQDTRRIFLLFKQNLFHRLASD